MIEGLSESTQLVLTDAAKIAGRFRDGHIGVEHLFVAIIELQEPGLQRVFTASGIDTVALAQEIESEAGVFSSGSDRELLLTPRAKTCLDAARLTATAFGHVASAPWLLGALLEDPLALPTRMLSSAGFQTSDLVHRARAVALSWTDSGVLRARVERRDRRALGDAMSRLGRDLVEEALAHRLHEVIGRDRELVELMAILMERGRTDPILLGEIGVGKTALVEGLAVLIAAGEVHPELSRKRILSIEVGALASGVADAHETERQLEVLLASASTDPDLILFIDDIHWLFLNPTSHASGVTSMLRQALAMEDLQFIGATTPAQYARAMEEDPSLVRRLSPLHVGELTPEDALAVLSRLKTRYEEFHGLQIDETALRAAVELSERYLCDRRLPAKALDLLNRACSDKRLRMWLGDHGHLGSLSREERRAAFEGGDGRRQMAPAVLTAHEVGSVVATWTGIPVGRLLEAEAGRLLNLEERISARIKGQDEAIAAVAQAIRTSRSGLGDPTKPIGSFLFLGPTGVGKTALAKALADLVFNGSDDIVRIDMSECQTRHDIWRLIGAAPGHVDAERGGMLTEAVKRRPYSLVLLDEAEKAHYSILDLFLQVLDDGRLTDGLGRTVNFRNTIVIMTSNLGSEQVGAAKLGFLGTSADAPDADAARRAILREAERYLRREFLNRIDRVVVFNPLPQSLLVEIAHMMVAKLPVNLEIDDDVAGHLVSMSYDPSLGARPLRRAIRELLVEPLALERLKGALHPEAQIRAHLRDGEIAFEVVDPLPRTPHGDDP